MKVNVDISPSVGGSVEIGGSTALSYPVTRTFKEGSTILLEAKPADGYEFVSWSGDVSGSENPITIEMDSHMAITANFSRAMHNVTMQVKGNGSTSPTMGIHSYGEGIFISIIATPDSGWRFNRWRGEGVSDPTSATTTLIVDSDKNVTASFSQIMHTLTMEISGEGSTRPATGTYNHAEGTVVSITATPDSGWRFDSWTGEVNDPDSSATTFTMDSDKTITANFSQAKLNGGIIGIIIATIGAGLATCFATRRQKS